MKSCCSYRSMLNVNLNLSLIPTYTLHQGIGR
nr:MAG TPA: hypothetical protein [Caudoviricetes sp.]